MFEQEVGDQSLKDDKSQSKLERANYRELPSLALAKNTRICHSYPDQDSSTTK